MKIWSSSFIQSKNFMSHPIFEPNDGRAAKLQVWLCPNCTSVHFNMGSSMLNFSRSEFDQLTRAAMEIFAKEHGEEKLNDIVREIGATDDDVLLSDTVV